MHLDFLNSNENAGRTRHRPLMLFASIGGLIGALPLFWLLNHPSELLAQLGQLGLVLLMGVYYGALPAILVRLRLRPCDARR